MILAKSTDVISFGEGLLYSALAISIVFLVLVVIAVLISFLRHLPDKQVAAKPTTVVNTVKPASPVRAVSFAELEDDEDKLVAAIVASMEATGEDKDAKYVVTRITQE